MNDLNLYRPGSDSFLSDETTKIKQTLRWIPGCIKTWHKHQFVNLRWLHRVIVYSVAREIVMIWMPLLPSFLHPFLQAYLYVISNDWIVFFYHLCKNYGSLSWIINAQTNVFLYFFMALYVLILNFLPWNLPNFWQYIAFCGIPILNTKKVGFVKAGFSIFAN